MVSAAKDSGPGLARVVLARRAARLRLLVSDVDGVLTDGGVYYSERGEEMKRFSVRDGMGVERLRARGVETALLTREPSAIVARRAEKLRIRLVYLGVSDKRLFLPRILDDAAVELDQLAYIGDDVNDEGAMKVIAARGLLGAPADARPEIRRLAHHRGTVAGGQGAFREFAEWLLELRASAELSLAGDEGEKETEQYSDEDSDEDSEDSEEDSDEDSDEPGSVVGLALARRRGGLATKGR